MQREDSQKKMTRLACYAIVGPMKLISILAIASLALTQTATAAEPATPEHSGLAVGQKAPSFTLKDQKSRDISLESLLKNGPVALVFFRSADW